MSERQVPAITSEIRRLSPDLVRILDPLRSIVNELVAGSGRAVRVSDLGSGLAISGGSVIANPIVVPSVAPQIERRIQLLEAAQTDVSTLADELLGGARFGSMLGAALSDVKTVKVDVNGHVAGLGVAVYGGAGGPISSDFVIQADRFSVVFPSPPWLASQAYTLGQYVSATSESGVSGVIFKVTTAGTTGTTEPAWNVTPGQTTASGSVVFTAATIDERVPFLVGNVGGVPTVGIDGTLLVDGTIEATAIEAAAITADKIAAGAVTAEKIATNLVLASQIEIAAPGYLRSGQTAYDTGIGWYWGYNSSTPVMSIGDSAGPKFTWDGSTLTVVGNVSGSLDAGSLVGAIPPSNFDISTLGWTLSSTFSATDGDTVAWTSGTLYTAAGQSFAIASGDTGDMTVRTYIFLDINVSTTVLQTTTTAANAVGAGRILVAVAEDDSPSAFFQVFGGSGSFGVSSPEIPTFGPLKNGDFETSNSTGWVTDASWTVDTSTPIDGVASARIATSSTGLRSDAFAAAPGDRFLITCVGERDGASLPDAALRLEVRWGSGAFSSELATASESTSGRQFLRILVTVPNGETTGQVVIRKSGGASGHWFADDVFVTPTAKSADISLGGASGAIDLATQISGTLTTGFAAAGLINANVTINADGTLSGAGGGQASLNSLPGTINLASQISGTLTTAYAAAGLINANITVNANGTLTGAGGGQVSLTSLPGSIAAGQIAANAVTTAALAAGAVTAAKIFAGTITANEIASATITGNRIAANTLTAANIAALTITAAEIAASTITGAKIAAQTITAGNIAANTITSGQIAADTIVASNIAASSITGSRIAAATILGSHIAAGTLTAANIAAGTISANELAANAVTANQIASGAVTATKLAATLIYGGEIIVDTNGHIRSGQTAYNTGSGWFIGNDGGTYRLSIGNPASTYLTWDGANLTVNGNVQIAQAETAFQVNYLAGFSSNPTGFFYYRRSGNLVFIRCDSACNGPSNSGYFAFNGWPPAIWPSGQRQMIVSVYNQGYLQPATLTINSDGNCGVVTYPGNVGFQGGNTLKGFTNGCVFVYSL